MLKREPGARIVHDPRLTWNTIDMVTQLGGKPVLCKSGHAFIKQEMREVDARLRRRDERAPLFPRVRLLRQRHDPLAGGAGRDVRARPVAGQLVGERQKLYPVSGEINREIADSKGVLARAQKHYEKAGAKSIDFTDGLSMEFDQWRFNLRGSNTEPLVRLNVETRGSEALMRDKTAEVLRLIDAG